MYKELLALGARCCGVLLSTVLLLSCGSSDKPVAQPAPVNILFVVVDDLRNWVNYSGEYPGRDIDGHSVHTPNIDALAAVSTRYLNAYVSMPQCTASRTSVLFGLSPATHGMTRVDYGIGRVYNGIYNNPELQSLPEVMSAGGYHAAAAGKVFNSQLPERWDEVGPATTLKELYNPFDPGRDGTYIEPGVLSAREVHPDGRVADWGVQFLREYRRSAAARAGKPFFLALGFYQPHMPWRVPQHYYDLYPVDGVVAPTAVPADLTDVPPQAIELAREPTFGGSASQHELIVAAGKSLDYTRAYLASISHTDAMLGRVLDALADSPYAKNTRVVFWSDHGFHLGEKFHWRKLTLWEPSVKVPLLISAPGSGDYPIGDVEEEVSLLDLAATVLDLAGLPRHEGFEGAPLHDAEKRSAVEIYLNEGRATVADGVKHIQYDLSDPAVSSRSRYDLKNDPLEIVNLEAAR